MISIKIIIPMALLVLMVIEVHAFDSQSSPMVGSNSLTSNVSSVASKSSGANEDRPVVIISPEKGTNQNVFNYTIYPPLSYAPPQIVVLTWLSPPAPLKNSSNYRSMDTISRNAKYWVNIEPIVISMRIPDDYAQRFLGEIIANLTIGSKLYTVPGPNITSYTTGNILQLENGSFSYNFDILSGEIYQICPSCTYEGQEQKMRMVCRNNTPGKEDSLSWLIPKENGALIKCNSNMVPWAI
jgi:hypothetical protein